MSVTGISEDEARAAALMARESALASLSAAGAPILALAGDPLRVVYANAAAGLFFGPNVAAFGEALLRAQERLAELLAQIPEGAAPRLERLRVAVGGAPQAVTLLCQRLDDDEGFCCFALAALGLRASAPAAESSSEPLPEPLAKAPGDATERLRAELAARHGTRPQRFVWKTDAEGRFVEVSPALAEIVGAGNADLLGRSVAEIAEALGLGAAFPQAIAARKSWSGVEVAWPLEAQGARAPARLGGLPAFDAARRFAGFTGYGVLDLAHAVAAAAPAPTQSRRETAPAAGEPASYAEETAAPVLSLEEAPAAAFRWQEQEQEFEPAEPGPPANVVPLRPHLPTGAGLTATERTAFDEIARALGGGASHRAARALIEQVGRQVGCAVEGGRLEPVPRQEDSPERAARLLDRLPVGVLVARGDAALYANRTLLDYLGYADIPALEADGGLARVFFGRAPSRDVSRLSPFHTISVQAQDGDPIEADAHLQIIDWDGDGPATLITLRRRRMAAPETLDASATQALLDAMSEPALLVSREGRILRANDAFARLVQMGKGAIVGQDLAALVAEEAGRPVKERLARTSEAAAEPLRILVKTRRGAPAAAQFSARNLGAGAEGPLCVTLREMGASPRSREELEAARVEAERSSAAKSEFLARVSHEIRTPLSAIIGFAEVMMEERFGPIGSERYKEYLKDVHASGAHVLSLVNDLLDLSKIEAGKMELVFGRVDANAIITECVSIMQAQASQERVIIRLALSSRLPPIRADERSLKQILLNLLSNAVKFNEPGGQVIVSSALTEGGFVVIRVKDTGIGMTQEEVQTALEPFRQVSTTRRIGGTGIGLPLTKALIEANHASFTIKSRKNEGTLIEVAFAPSQVLAAE